MTEPSLKREKPMFGTAHLPAMQDARKNDGDNSDATGTVSASLRPMAMEQSSGGNSYSTVAAHAHLAQAADPLSYPKAEDGTPSAGAEGYGDKQGSQNGSGGNGGGTSSIGANSLGPVGGAAVLRLWADVLDEVNDL